MVNEELAHCAQINFENFERAVPLVLKHPYYMIAKAQLVEALGGPTMEETLGPPRELGSVTFNKDGSMTRTGIMKDATITEVPSDE